jgi:hypothetical protein
MYPNVHLETEETVNTQGSTQQKATLEVSPYFKLYYRTIAVTAAWFWHKSRYEDQWNRIEDLDMNPHSYAHLIFDKDAKNV